MAEKGLSREESVRAESAPAKAWLAAAAAWLVPGAGHLLQGRVLRGLLLGGAVWAMFIIGLRLGGHLFPLAGPYDDGLSTLLQVPPVIANLGAGVLYLFCLLTRTGFTDQASLATYEYGNTFLLVAGLLNYLIMLDAFDIGAGRKP
ncbi:MAG TPA: DUF6677 family protein [Pyrinomonadaceae bacterium]